MKKSENLGSQFFPFIYSLRQVVHHLSLLRRREAFSLALFWQFSFY